MFNGGSGRRLCNSHSLHDPARQAETNSGLGQVRGATGSSLLINTCCDSAGSFADRTYQLGDLRVVKAGSDITIIGTRTGAGFLALQDGRFGSTGRRGDESNSRPRLSARLVFKLGCKALNDSKVQARQVQA